MPVIPTYEQQQLGQAAGLPTDVPAIGQASARALAQVGQSVANLADVAVEWENQKAKVGAAKAAADYQLDGIRALDEAQKNFDPAKDPAGLSKDYAESMRKRRNDFAEGASGFTRKHFDAQADDIDNRLRVRAFETEAIAVGKFQVGQVSDAGDSLAKTVILDPTMYDQAVESFNALADSMDRVPADKRAEAKTVWAGNVAEAVLDDMVESDPVGAGAILADMDNKFTKALSPEQLSRLRDGAENGAAVIEADEFAVGVFNRYGMNRPFDAEREIRKKYAKDPDKQRAAMARYNQMESSARTQKAAEKDAAMNAILAMRGAGKSTSDVLRSKAYRSRDPDDQKRILEWMVSDDIDGTSLMLKNAQTYIDALRPEYLMRATESQINALEPVIGAKAAGNVRAASEKMKNPKKAPQFRIESDEFDVLSMRLFKVDSRSTGVENKRKYAALKMRSEEILESHPDATTIDERSKILQREMAKMVSVDYWFDRDVSVLQLSEEDKRRVIVPADQRERISARLRAAYEETGDPDFEPTEENMRAAYLESLGGAGSAVASEGGFSDAE